MDEGFRRSKRKRKGPKRSDDESQPKKRKQKKFTFNGSKPLIWPLSVEYSSRLISGNNLSKEVKKKMVESASSFISENVRVGVVESLNHPAQGEWGLFAAKDLEPGKVLGEYAGKLRMGDVSRKRTKETHTLNVTLNNGNMSVEVDAEKEGNEFRFINDCKNKEIGKPNIKFESVPLGGEWHFLVVTTDIIRRGEELLADYGGYCLEASNISQEYFLQKRKPIEETELQVTLIQFFDESFVDNEEGMEVLTLL